MRAPPLTSPALLPHYPFLDPRVCVDVWSLPLLLEALCLPFSPPSAHHEASRAANENPSEIVSHTSIPRPAFILARYVSTKAGTLEGDHIASIPKVLDIYVAVRLPLPAPASPACAPHPRAQKAQTLGVLIWFFNVSAVLYRFTSKFTKAPTSDAVSVIINWQDRKYFSLRTIASLFHSNAANAGSAR